MLRIGLIQMHCEKGAIAQNMARIVACLQEAAALGVEIVGFPEMCLTGYADPTQNPNIALHLDGPEVKQLLELTRPYAATVLVGLIEHNPAGKPFITQLVVQQGKLLGHYRKVTIQDEELAWFAAGDGVPVFQRGALTFGLAICADIENEAVFAACKQQGAQLVFELAAPGLYGAQATRNWAESYAWWAGECQQRLSHYAQAHQLWIGVATQAGRTVDEDFPGGGYVFAPTGARVFATPDWAPGAVYLALDFANHQVVAL